MQPSKIIQSLKEGIKTEQLPGKVIIVGAGIAGLTAALILQKSGVEVSLLEAGVIFGGRIRSLEQFAELSIELGAEEIHADKNAWFELLNNKGFRMYDYEEEFDEYFYLDGRLCSKQELENDADLKRAASFFEEEIWEYEGEEKTVAELILEKNIPPRVAHLLDAWIGAEYGTSNKQISAKSLAASAKKWNAGDFTLLLDTESMGYALQEIFEEALEKIIYETEVVSIDYSGDQVLLKDQKGMNYQADKVILTVPLPVLQQGRMAFFPDLPEEKKQAIQTIGMDAGMKIFLKFKERFWDAHMGSLFGNGQVYEYYSYPKSEEPVLIAFVMGEQARALSQMNENEAIQLLLQDLDRIFGEKKASGTLEKFYTMDWLKDPFTAGAYSFPSAGSEEAREILAKAINQKLFFAGEATHTGGHFATVHGALETGYRAALEVLQMDPSSK